MQVMPHAVPISDIKNKPTEVLELVAKGPVILTTRGSGVAVVTSINEWNTMALRLARLERLMRLRAARQSKDLVDYEYANAG